LREVHNGIASDVNPCPNKVSLRGGGEKRGKGKERGRREEEEGEREGRRKREERG
jgi:hypothetical protein